MRRAFVWLLLGMLLAAQEGEDSSKYRWPLDINNGYSSSFQEFRTNHFHGGMDLRTFQKTGYPVYAITDGQIFKIRMVKRGSGRGLYLRHNDGNTSIYFHLDRFAERIESILRQVQQARGKYFGNYFLKPPLAVKKGELIAYSGETGYGFPHLHLEIRDPHYAALNPFQLVKFPDKDINSPRLKALIFRNRGDSLVNGRIGESFFRFVKKGENFYVLDSPVVVSGDFDLVLQAHDVSDSHRWVAPYQISASIDGEEYFQLAFDRFERDDNNQLGFVYDMFYSRSNSYCFNLFFQRGFELENRKIFPESVMGNLSEGRHELRLLVRDNFGNESTGIVPLYKIEKPGMCVTNMRRQGSDLFLDVDKLNPRFAEHIMVSLFDDRGEKISKGELNLKASADKRELSLKGIPEDSGYMDFDFVRQGVIYFKRRYLLNKKLVLGITDIHVETYINRDEVFVKVRDAALTASNTLLKVIQGPDSRLLKPGCSGDTIFFWFKPMNLNHQVLLNFTILLEGERVAEIQRELNLIFLQEGIKQAFNFEEFGAEFYPRAVYEPKVLQVETKAYESEFPVLSKQVSLSPYHFPFLDTVYYTFKKIVNNPAQVGIFRFNPGENSWHYVPTSFARSSHVFKTRVISSGTFALMRDIYPPEIYFIKPGTKHAKYLKKLVIKITDKGKGVNDATLRVWLNDQRMDCEYDPDWRSVKIEDLANIKIGRNVLKVVVQDYARHRSSKIFPFYLN